MTITNQWKKVPILLAGAMIAAAPAQAQQDGSLRSGERMIARCLEHAASRKSTPLSVAVIDASGTLVAFKRQDGASAATTDAALLKARTALRMNAPTAALAQAAAEDASTRDALLVMQMTTIPGGVPFPDKGGAVAGAVGVSGGIPDQDAACAEQAIAPEAARKK